VALPTGLGKTMIATVVLYNYWRWYPRGKLVFVVPTRPLAVQQEQACQRVTDIPQSDMCVMIGSSYTPDKRRAIYATKRLIFATPQIIDADFKSGTLNPADVVCLVVDEAHKATGDYAYVNLARGSSCCCCCGLT
jgi:ERCC4-related helicase